MSQALELELMDGPALPQQRWRIVDGFRIGRATTSQLELNERSVSRRHAAIARDDSGWALRDCRSRLGTFLNELALVPDIPAALHDGDVIAIGLWRFRVSAAPTEIAAATAVRSASPSHIDLVGQLGNLAEQRLELLLRCAGEVAAATDEQALADALAEHALLGSGYARAAVIWRKGGELVLRSLRPIAAAHAAAFRFNGSLLASAEGGEVARLDAEAEPSTGAAPTMRRALCAPLMLDGRAEAFLYLDSNRAARRGHADAPTFAQALARLAALALANLQRLDSERERTMLTADIERAREVQRRLLPDDHATIGGLGYALHLHPGRSVAGDVVDVFELPDGKVAALLGDVSGAGLGAGLVMASVQSFLRAELAHHSDPARALTRLNSHLHAQASRGRFVTLWLGIFAAATRVCHFVDAGHAHALRLRAGLSAGPIATHGGIPLGIAADVVFNAETLQLGVEELILLYSDGVIEQRAPDAVPFTRERLIDAVRAAANPTAAVEQALQALAVHAASTAPDDDMTLLALGWATAP